MDVGEERSGVEGKEEREKCMCVRERERELISMLLSCRGSCIWRVCPM